MKIPSLIKIPKHQRFHIEPRYYDPVKEEIEQRTSQIKKELELDGVLSDETQSEPRKRINGSFSGRMEKTSKGVSASVFQLLLMVVLSISFVGYLYFGNVALYLFGIFMLLFVYVKYRKIF